MIVKQLPRQDLREGIRGATRRRRYTPLNDEESENAAAEEREFRIVGAIAEVEKIATGRQIREIRRLNRTYGRGRWRKLKGFALVHDRTTDEFYRAEIHWYEATGIGRRELKIKRRLSS